MNSSAGTDATHPYVALAGRVPCKVVGKVAKGDRLISSDRSPGHAKADWAQNEECQWQEVIGRSLEDKTTAGEGIIEIVVGAK